MSLDAGVLAFLVTYHPLGPRTCEARPSGVARCVLEWHRGPGCFEAYDPTTTSMVTYVHAEEKKA